VPRGSAVELYDSRASRASALAAGRPASAGIEMAENPIKSAAGAAAKDAVTQPATSASGPAARTVGCCASPCCGGAVPEEDRGMMPDSRRKCRDVACCLVFMCVGDDGGERPPASRPRARRCRRCRCRRR
jgi:hypothetical protein